MAKSIDELLRELDALKNGNASLKALYEKDIIEYKLALEELKQSSQKWKAIVTTSPDGIGIATLEGRIQIISDKLVKMHGYLEEKPEDFLRRSVFDFIDPADHNKLSYNIRKLLTGDRESNLTEYIGIRKDKSRFNIDLNSTLLLDSNGKPESLLFVERDITKRKMAEEALRESEEKYRLIFEHSPVGILSFDNNGAIIACNDKFVEIIGSSREAIIGLNMVNLSDEELVSAIKKAQGGSIGFYDGIYHSVTAKKSTPVRAIFTPMNVGGGVISGGVGIIEDITEQKKSELIIREQFKQLQDLNSAKDKFFSIISHDLRSPFQDLIMLTELLSEGVGDISPAKLSELGKQMHENAKNLLKLLSNLLEWSRMQQGIFSFEPKDLNLSKIISENINLIINRGEQKGIELISYVPNDLLVFVDNDMLNSTIRNLLSNAVKFTLDGGIVTISSKISENNMIEVSIKDSGIGMSPELCSRLFKMDEKVGRKGTGGEGSTGLGLLLCKEFIEKHGGKIWAESQEHVGSTFYFTLHSTGEKNI